ncbi:YkgJ family cysteine cluster protein [Verrucomicrobiota bacterium]
MTDGSPTTAACVECGAKCCRYVALQIDDPTCKRDYDNIRWYLMHKGVFVFVDHEGDWYIEFETDCSRLGSDGLCRRYEERPRICREHGGGARLPCESAAEAEPHKVRFSEAVEFERYLDSRRIDWRWKRA